MKRKLKESTVLSREDYKKMYDVYKLREQFPMLNNKTMQGHPLVYLDNASTTFKPQCVIDKVNEYYTEKNANSHRGDYDLCYLMDLEIENVRKKVANFVNSNVDEVIFTSGDTESLNLLAYGYCLKNLKKGDGILISLAEHASNVLPWFNIGKMTGSNIYYVDMVDNKITPEKVEEAFKKHPNIKFVSFACIGNVLGYKIDVKSIAKIAHEYGAVISIDGAQSVPHTKTNFSDDDIDFLSFSAHKMCGPTGVGVLVGKRSLLKDMDTFITGGGMNVTFTNNGEFEALQAPRKFEAGTQNLAGIMGFGAAIDFINSIGIDNIEKHEKELHQYLLKKLEKVDDVIIYNKDAEGSILAFNKKDVFAQDEATLLNSKGIAVRSGEHCAKMIDDLICTPATVRMSTYLYTTKEEIDIFVENLINGGDILDAYFLD